MPDQSVLDVAGSGRDLDAAAVSTSGDFAVIYLSTRHSVNVDLGKVSASGQVRATWINPETGELSGQAVSASAGLHSFTPALQREDAVLLLEAVRSASFVSSDMLHHLHPPPGRGAVLPPASSAFQFGGGSVFSIAMLGKHRKQIPKEGVCSEEISSVRR